MTQTPKTRAASNRKRLLAEFGDSSACLVATVPEHITYCSGFKSMGHDTDRQLQMAVVFDARDFVVIGHQADRWCAEEVLNDDSKYFSYGSFFFEQSGQIASETSQGKLFKSFEEALIAALLEVARPDATVAFDTDRRFPGWHDFLHRIGGRQIQDAAIEFKRCRSIKSAEEVALIDRASLLTEDAILAAFQSAGPGVTELELAAEISSIIVSGGGLPGFMVVTSGERSALADAYPTDRRLRAGDILRVDVGCTVDGYWSDTARCAVVGEPDQELLKVFSATTAGQLLAREMVRTGAMADEIFEATVEAVHQAGLPHYKRHHVGHGLGLECSEYPVIAAGNRVPIEEGMVINLETPYYRVGWGGVMVEDTIWVTDSGPRLLTQLDRDLYIIPA